jgi:hypothetical protein
MALAVWHFLVSIKVTLVEREWKSGCNPLFCGIAAHGRMGAEAMLDRIMLISNQEDYLTVVE